MKKQLPVFALAALMLSFAVPVTVRAQETATDMVALDEANFPDAAFRTYCTSNFDLNGDEQLSQEEIAKVSQIVVEWEDTITDLKGVEYFTELTELKCSGTGITSLDISKNDKLEVLECYYTSLDSLDVSNNPELQILYCFESSISALDVSNNEKLYRLDCNNTPIKELDVTNNPELFALNCEDTQVSQLDISKNPALYEVYITNTPISSMDYTNNPELVHIRISGTNMTSLDVSKNPKLAALYCSDTKLKELDLSNNPGMFEIFCSNTDIEALDVTGFPGLTTLDCQNTKITELNVSNNINLAGLYVSNTKITTLDVSKNTALQRLEFSDTSLSNIDLSGNPQLRYLKCTNTNMEQLDFTGYQNLEEVYCSNANVKTLKLPAGVYGLDCSKNHITELDLSQLDMWMGAEFSQQARTAYYKESGNTLTLNLKDLVSDITKVSVPDSEDYSYDRMTGILTLNSADVTEVVYQYDTGCEENTTPMDVTLTLKKQENIPDGEETVPPNNGDADKEDTTPQKPVVEKGKADVPQTGDSADTTLYLIMMAMAGGCFAFFKRKKI